jgi:hypothetical protein
MGKNSYGKVCSGQHDKNKATNESEPDERTVDALNTGQSCFI